MQFNTPYGTADDQSASYLCGLEEGLAIGAITGGVNSGNGNQNIDYGIEGGIIGYSEDVYKEPAITHYTAWIEQSEDGGYWFHPEIFVDLIYSCFQNTAFSVSKVIKNSEFKEATCYGVRVYAGSSYIELYIEVEKFPLTGKVLNVSSFGTVKIRVQKGDKSTATGNDNTTIEIKKEKNGNSYRYYLNSNNYAFDAEMVWLDNIALWYTTDDVWYIPAIGWYHIELGQVGGPLAPNYGGVAVTPNLFSGFFPGKIEEETRTLMGVTLCTMKSTSSVDTIEAPNFGMLLTYKSGVDQGLKITLATDTSKYFYIRRWDRYFWIINRGTL